MPRCLLVLAFVQAGCSGYYTDSGRAAAQGALDGLTGPSADAKYAQAAAAAAQSAGAAARGEILGLQTSMALTTLVKDEGLALRAEIVSTVETAGAATRVELAKTFTAEQGYLQQAARLTLDEALGTATQREVAALREELAGAPLRADIDAVIDSAAPHLTRAAAQALGKVVLPVQTAADAEAGKWRPIAEAFAVGCGLLCVCLGFTGWLVREHQKTIRAMAARPSPRP